MQITLLSQGKNNPPALGTIRTPIADLSDIDHLTFVVVEGGMQSGEPSVLIVVQDPDGSVVIQTSLDKLMTAASGLATMAETEWGWKRPEGHATMMPPNKESRKVLLEAIKKELEEWDNE